MVKKNSVFSETVLKPPGGLNASFEQAQLQRGVFYGEAIFICEKSEGTGWVADKKQKKALTGKSDKRFLFLVELDGIEPTTS